MNKSIFQLSALILFAALLVPGMSATYAASESNDSLIFYDENMTELESVPDSGTVTVGYTGNATEQNREL